MIKELIDADAIGDVKELTAWCSLTYYPYGHVWWSSPLDKKTAQGQPVPESLDWNAWLGPAADRDYHKCYHPGSWRCWWDFGCGMMGDRGAHTFDPIFYALGMRTPLFIEASSSGGNEDVHPIASIITYQFDKLDDKPPFKLT